MRPITYGETLMREKPMVAHPSQDAAGKVCHSCLKALGPQRVYHPDSKRPFCCEACMQEAEALFHAAESAADLSALRQLCATAGERFPLMAARLALVQMTAAARKLAEAAAAGEPAAAQQQPAAAAAADPSAPVQGDPLHDANFLCFANVGKPYPEPWVQQHELLAAALQRAAAALAAAAGQAPQAALALAAPYSLEWYVSVLSRLHINVFRVDSVMMMAGDMGAGGASLAELASAAVLAAEGGGSSSGRDLDSSMPGSAGSAAYVVASLLNHSCEPNLDVNFPRSDSTAAFVAARDIDHGEELTISYIDQYQSLPARRQQLYHSYGFICKCIKCREEESGAAA